MSGPSSIFLRLQRLAKINNTIEKCKKYIKPGQKPPKGVMVHQGKYGGHFYYVEDKHLETQGKHYQLVRGKGITEDQFDEARKKQMENGAENVHFVYKPGLEKNEKGQKLYNIYIHNKQTQEEGEKKKQAAKESRKRRHDLTLIKKPEPKKEPEKPSGNVGPEPLGQAVKPQTPRREGQYQTRESADRKKRSLEAKGLEVEVKEKKLGKSTVYSVYSRKSVPATAKPPEKKEEKPAPEPPVQHEDRNWQTSGLQHKTRGLAEDEARKLENQGHEVRMEGVEEMARGGKIKKYYTVHHRPKPAEEKPKEPEKKPEKPSRGYGVTQAGLQDDTLRLQNDPSIGRAWLRHYTTQSDDENEIKLYGGELIQPHLADEDSLSYHFPKEGLYQAKGSTEYSRRYYKVKNGKPLEISEKEWNHLAKDLPLESHAKLKDEMDKNRAEAKLQREKEEQRRLFEERQKARENKRNASDGSPEFKPKYVWLHGRNTYHMHGKNMGQYDKFNESWKVYISDQADEDRISDYAEQHGIKIADTRPPDLPWGPQSPVKPSAKRIRLVGDTYNNKEWIKTIPGWRYHPEGRFWSVPDVENNNERTARMQEYRKRGINAIDMDMGPLKSMPIQKAFPDLYKKLGQLGNFGIIRKARVF